MLTRLAWLSVRRRRLVLVLSGLFLCTAGALGSGAFGVLEDGGFEDPHAESTRAADALERSGRNAASVALGLERTGRIVSAAAALLAITFLAFGTADVAFLKLFGVGLALAVVLDATVIRGLLVPAFMRLAGPANWWTPAPLRRLHRRFGIAERPAPVLSGGPTGVLVHATEGK